MLDVLKFVQGAIVKKTFAPELAHFQIKDRLVKSFNGIICLCSPIALDIEAAPKAAQFVKAIQTCKEIASIHMTKANRLAIQSGPFKAFIECLNMDNQSISLEPEGTVVEINGEFLPVIKKLYPFIAEDASRQWARGILFRGQSAFATNNITLVEHWLDFVFPVEVNVPQEALRELLRIGEEPTALQVDSNSLTFHFEKGRWLKTVLYETAWPDVSELLDSESNQQPFPNIFFEAVESLLPFLNETESVLFRNNEIATEVDPETGSVVSVETLASGRFSAKQLLLLRMVANTIDFALYPGPCLFYGDSIRGVILGMKYEI